MTEPTIDNRLKTTAAQPIRPSSARARRPGGRAAPDRLRVGVIGGTGYTGALTAELVLAHPHAELACISSERSAGRLVASPIRVCAAI